MSDLLKEVFETFNDHFSEKRADMMHDAQQVRKELTEESIMEEIESRPFGEKLSEIMNDLIENPKLTGEIFSAYAKDRPEEAAELLKEILSDIPQGVRTPETGQAINDIIFELECEL